jgi:hypothetical protein
MFEDECMRARARWGRKWLVHRCEAVATAVKAFVRPGAMVDGAGTRRCWRRAVCMAVNSCCSLEMNLPVGPRMGAINSWKSGRKR